MLRWAIQCAGGSSTTAFWQVATAFNSPAHSAEGIDRPSEWSEGNNRARASVCSPNWSHLLDGSRMSILDNDKTVVGTNKVISSSRRNHFVDLVLENMHFEILRYL